MASSRPVFAFFVDWNNDGDFADTGDNITTRARAADGLTVAYGRDQARAFSPAQPGQAAFSLNNTSRDYYPDNSSSPLAGNLVPGRPVKITATQDAATTIIYRGFLDDFTLSPNKGDRTVTLSCLDALARFQQANPLSTGLSASIRTGTAIGLILDQLGWPGGARDIDPGATTIRWWWEEGTDGLTALGKMLAAEGPPAMCYVDTNANFVFRDRHHRYLRGASAVIQCTLTNGTSPESGAGPYDTLAAAATPLAWWQLDDAAGSGTAADSSGNSHPGTATGLAFGNTSAAVTGNTTASLLAANTPKILTGYNPSFAAGITVEAWVNYNSQSQGANSPRLVANSHTDVDHNGFQLMVSNAGQPQFWVGKGTSAGNAAGGSVPASGWTYLAGTYDGTNIRIYVNGVLQTTSGFTGTVTAGAANTGLGYNPAYNGDYLSGLLAECAVYAGAATAAQVLARYQATPVTVTFSQPMSYDTGWRDICNTVILPVDQRDVQAVAQVWSTDATITLGASASTDISAQASDPFTGAVTPVSGTDFTVTAGSATASLDRTSGQSATITLTAGGGGATITGLALRANPVTVSRTVQVTESDSASVTAYGVRGLPDGIDPSFATAADADAVAGLFVARYAQRKPIVTLPVNNLNAGRLTQQLARDLSDRVHITDTETGLNADFFIEQISHETAVEGRVLTTTFGCEKADATSPSNLFVFDDAANGTFGTGKFGT